MPKSQPKVFVAAHVRKDVADELRRLAAQNERSLAQELRVAITNHLAAELSAEAA